MTAATTTRIQRLLHSLRSAILPLLARDPDVATAARGMLETVNEIDSAVLSSLSSDSELPGSDDRLPDRRRGQEKRYEVERDGRDEVLAEYRGDHPYPYRATKAVFDAVVAVLAAAREPLDFARIRDEAGRRLGETPAEYAVRVCLRYLGPEGRGWVRHHRTRFAAIEPTKLRRQAESAWADLRVPRG